MEMETAAGIAKGAMTGAVVASAASTAVAATAGAATVSTFRAVGTIGATAGVVVAAPVALQVLAVGAVARGLAASVTKLFGMW